MAAQTPAGVDASSSPEAPAAVPEESVDLIVFAASSLTEPFGEIGNLFEASNPGATVVFNFAGSQQLAQQINEGAPADVFASASKKWMDAVIEAGEIVSRDSANFCEKPFGCDFSKGQPGWIGRIDGHYQTRPKAGARREGSPGRPVRSGLFGQGGQRSAIRSDVQRRGPQ